MSDERKIQGTWESQFFAPHDDSFIGGLLNLLGARDPNSFVPNISEIGAVPFLQAKWRANPKLRELVAEMLKRKNELEEANTVYHATYPHHAIDILKSGEIRPGDYSPGGVSVSRVPVIKTKESPVTIEIDPKMAPSMRPLAEFGFRKSSYSINSTMNPYFEFENRTQGQSIPIEAIKRIFAFQPSIAPYHLDQLQQIAAGKVIPFELLSSPQELQAIRAMRFKSK